LKVRQVDSFAVIEKVGAMPGNGVSSMFKFGRGTGVLIGCLIAAGIPFAEVTPQVWQKGFGIPTRRKKGRGAESKTDFKNRLRSVAQKLFPRVDVTSETADALLLALYCQRLCQGKR
jgi:hypothetical protein